MPLRPVRFLLILSFLLSLISVCFPTDNVQALAGQNESSGFPSLETFVEQVSNGKSGELRGVYIPDILAAPIVQQPAGMEDFVSPRQNVLTQFSLASRLGSTGLLAHNFLAGETFPLLAEGQEINLIHGDGSVSTYKVTAILRYQAIASGKTSSLFVNLDTHASISSASLFTQVYNRPGQVVFQTCIEAGGNLEWGRLFVIAQPAL
jgi:hypothetical protein